MTKEEADHLKAFVDIAIKAGATAATLVPARMVAVDERVRLKCEIPRCAGYGRYLTCPPHTMDVATFSRILSRFEWSLLVQVEANEIDSTDKAGGRIGREVMKEKNGAHRPYKLKLLHVVETVEAAAFKKGMRFATGLVGGSCVLCEQCVEDRSCDACRHPFRARPAMEGVGIDVFETARNAGLPIHLSSKNHVRWTGLILLC